MFTGLVEEVGTLDGVSPGAKGAELRIRTARLEDLVLGESIAVDGVCLTVKDRGVGWFTVDASEETLARTTLARAAPGGRVHLERALALGDRLGGHLVTGHVDGVGEVAAHRPRGDSLEVTYAVPERLAPFLAPKGSITVDGTSLTINEVEEAGFRVVLVPWTRAETKLDATPPGGPVNLEVDVLAKYVASLLRRPGVTGGPDDGGVSLDLLRRQGYV
ncbi:MAG TPA: riboflavin synthase [Polyangiaceae bacterium LLY-WYZ-14_1]|nr:riboflavin synthase [Polyangiaceae bacterium LLY-WYZ-14_1]